MICTVFCVAAGLLMMLHSGCVAAAICCCPAATLWLLGLLCRWLNHGRHREAQENAHMAAAARTWRSAC